MDSAQTFEGRDPVSGGVRAVRDGGQMLVTLWGDHDLATLDHIDAALTEAATTGLDVVVDLRDVEFMDASTVGALVDGGVHVAEHGRRLSIQAVHGLPRRLLEICGLSAMVDPDPPPFDGQPAPTTALEAWVQVPKADRSTDRATRDRATTFARALAPDDPEPSWR